MSRVIKRIESVDELTAEILRRKAPAERLAMTFRMWDFARDLITNVLRHEHPAWTEREILHEAARRLSHGAI